MSTKYQFVGGPAHGASRGVPYDGKVEIEFKGERYAYNKVEYRVQNRTGCESVFYFVLDGTDLDEANKMIRDLRHNANWVDSSRHNAQPGIPHNAHARRD